MNVCSKFHGNPSNSSLTQKHQSEPHGATGTDNTIQTNDTLGVSGELWLVLNADSVFALRTAWGNVKGLLLHPRTIQTSTLRRLLTFLFHVFGMCAHKGPHTHSETHRVIYSLSVIDNQLLLLSAVVRLILPVILGTASGVHTTFSSFYLLIPQPAHTV